MNKANILTFAVLVFLNTTVVFGWWGCDPKSEGEGCSAFCKCKSGLTCEAWYHKCHAPGKAGDPCHATKPCGSGLSCQPGVHRCYHTPRGLGEPCVAGHPCRAGYFCEKAGHVCKQIRYTGESCASKYQECSGSWRTKRIKCVDGVCIVKPAPTRPS